MVAYFPNVTENVDWGKHFPAANGSRQSPIDFLSGVTQYDSALTDNPLNINYSTSRETDILNNGQNLVIYPKYKGGKVMGSEVVTYFNM